MTCELLFRDDAYLQSCDARVSAVSARGVELDRTVFYPAGGGQPGDTGWLRRADGVTVRMIDSRKGAEPDTVIHVPEADAPTLAVGDAVTATLDWERRYAHMRIH
ncbi:MAG: alanyl-tRNA editing protein, partial [Candidatus Competibacteraceae bacterium]|nr:alanyl-tRNA editing protein [Candidatus Competibacteraceae bacterium]